jgi:hypothetical protein
MPNLPGPGHRDVPAISDTSLAALLAGQPPPDQSGTAHPAADIVAALRAAPAPDELGGEALALAEFRSRRPGLSRPAGRARRRSPRRRGTRLPARAAAAAAVAAIGAGSLASAAYAGVLPAPIQRFAHTAILAPAAHRGRSQHGTWLRADQPAPAGCQDHGPGGTVTAGAARSVSALGATAPPAGAQAGRSSAPCRRTTAPRTRLPRSRAVCSPVTRSSRSLWTAAPGPGRRHWTTVPAGPDPGTSRPAAAQPVPAGAASARPRPARTSTATMPPGGRSWPSGPQPSRSCAAFWWRSDGQGRHWLHVTRPVPGGGSGSRRTGWPVPHPERSSPGISSGPGRGEGAPQTSKPVQGYPNSPPSRQ